DARRRSPAESVSTERSARSERPHAASAPATASAGVPRKRAKNVRFSRAVRPWSNIGRCPMYRSSPVAWRRPRASGTRPASARRSVVFPAPLGPRRTVRPGPISSETSRRITRSSITTVASWSDAQASTVRMMGRVVGTRGPPARVLVAFVAVLVAACGSEPPATDPVARGGQVYRALNCGSCHEPNLFGQRLGPPLDHVGSVAATRRSGLSAPDYIRQSIIDPGAFVVPGYQDSMPRDLGRDLSPTDLDALVAYLLSLK